MSATQPTAPPSGSKPVAPPVSDDFSTSQEPCCNGSVIALALAIILIVGGTVFAYFQFPDHKVWVILGGGASLVVALVVFACVGGKSDKFEDFIVAPVGKSTPPPPSSYPFVQAFLNNYRHIRIAGDGHCFFRASGLGFLTLYHASTPAEQAAIVQRFEGFRNEPRYNAILPHIETVIRLLQDKRSPSEKMRNNEMVFALRELVCAYNMGQPDKDVYVSQAAAYSGSLANYLLKMRTTTIMAGDAERIALAKVLGLQVTIYDSTLKKPTEVDFLATATPDAPVTRSLIDATITLYYVEKHYNLLIPNHLDSK